jgi:ankyrin repeat protein
MTGYLLILLLISHTSTLMGMTETKTIKNDGVKLKEAATDTDKNKKTENIEIVQKILQTDKAAINEQDSQGRTALIWAANMGNDAIVAELIKNNADLNHQDKDGLTALAVAADEGHVTTVKILLDAGASPTLADYKIKWTPLQRAQKNGHTEMAKLLEPVAKEFDKRGEQLIYAALDGDIKQVQSLLVQGASVNIRESFGESQNTALMKATESGHEEIVQLLLDAKADPNIQASYGITALMLAARKGSLAIVKSLLDAKADPNIQSVHGETALMDATGAGHEKIVELLLKAKANPNIRDNTGETALIKAAKKWGVLLIEQLLKAGANPLIIDRRRKTALSWAREKGNFTIWNLLMSAEAGTTPTPVVSTAAMTSTSEELKAVANDLAQLHNNLMALTMGMPSAKSE